MKTRFLASGRGVELEIHTDTDQFLRIEAGKARVAMGPGKATLDQVFEAEDKAAIFIPTGYWYTFYTIGDEPPKMY
ncbi:MAG: cupin domain-containing protein [Spirochaetales bacterium]|nr:cupin domain-containing protein [Spirochaetales bacterium]